MSQVKETTSSQSKTPPDVIIEKRRPTFHFTRNDDTWIPLGPGLETYLDHLSCTFPSAERFFVRSVHHYRHQITDKKLLDDVNRFIAQEAMHGISHDKLNHAFEKRNHFPKLTEKLYQPLLAFLRRFTSRRVQLAFTVCTEHFNATYLDLFAANDQWLKKHVKMPHLALWAWHTIEETEHKSVAFDVYTAVSNNKIWAYVVRSITMLLMSITCFIGIHFCLLCLAIGRKNTPSIKMVPTKKPWWKQKVHEFDTGTAQRTWRVALFIVRHTFKHYLSFYRPSYHPWQHDNRSALKKLTTDYFVEEQQATPQSTPSCLLQENLSPEIH